MDKNTQSAYYLERLKEELHHFNAHPDTENRPAIADYWSRKFLTPLLREAGFEEAEEFFAIYLKEAAERVGGPAVFASLGAGDCQLEVKTAQLLKNAGLVDFTIECLDFNKQQLERGYALAIDARIEQNLSFVEVDFNRWTASKRYTAITASHSLHHMVELEHVFDEVKRALDPAGFFIATDMIGRNGHQRWPEALQEMRPFWHELPLEYRWNRQLKRLEEEYVNHDCSTQGFEGIRAQDILPLLLERFDFRVFIAFSNLVDVFVDRGFGGNFDANAEWDCAFIDRLHAYDEQAIVSGRLTPTHMYAVMTPGPGGDHFYSRGLAPAKCVHCEETSSCVQRLEVATPVLRPLTDGGLEYSMRLEGRGGQEPYTWSATDLPPDLYLSQDGSLRGSIEADGVFTPVIKVKDSSEPPRAAAQRYTIIIKPSRFPIPLTAISPEVLTPCWVGSGYAERVQAIGGKCPLRWSIEGPELPPGLVLNPETGEICGTATQSCRNSFQIKVIDSAGSVISSKHEITVEPGSEDLRRIGFLPHVTAGGSWRGAIRLSNTEATSVEVELRFRASSGQRKYWPLKADVPLTSQHGHFRLAPQTSIRVEFAVSGQEEISGWAEIFATGSVGAHAELEFTSPSGVSSEVSIPMDKERRRQSLRLPFDNSGTSRTAVALLCVPETCTESKPDSARQPHGLTAAIRNEDGRLVETRHFRLLPGRHKAFMLADEVPATLGRSGFIELRSVRGEWAGGVSLRLSGKGTFVLLPLL